MLDAQGKRDMLARYRSHYGLQVTVETGVYGGGFSTAQFTGVDNVEVWVLDVRPENVTDVAVNHPSVRTACGDTRWTLPTVLACIDRPALFWLDAHLTEDDGDVLEAIPCPLLEELAYIRHWEHAARSVVLVDDVRLLGENRYPTLERLLSVAGDVWRPENREDVLRLAPW